MANSKQIETLLLTEHFRFTPIALIDDIINIVNERTYSATDQLESALLSADPSALGFSLRAEAEGRIPDTDENGNAVFPESKLEIEEGVQKLETLLENTIDKNFDKLEIYTLRNVLTVPGEFAAWVRLGHYENLTFPPKDPTLTPESLHQLRRKAQETQKLHTALLAEKTRNEALLSNLRSLLSPAQPLQKQEPRSSTSPQKQIDQNPNKVTFDFLTHSSASKTLGIQPLPTAPSHHSKPNNAQESQVGPLTTHTTFTLSQLPHLRAQLAALRPYIASTALPSSAVGEQAKLGKERRDYVESQTRRILERRGVDVRGGGAEALEGGGRVRGEEVRGLEGLVGGLGRGGVDERGDDGEEMDLS